MSRRVYLSLICVCFISIIISCKHNPSLNPNDGVPAVDGNYPPEVAKIIMNRCAIAGCHNQASYSAADSLLLDSWDHLFNGDNNGAVAIPYRPEYSTLLYYVNTDTAQGPIFTPTMPENGRAPLLSKAEYMTLYNWIAAGAPDKNGNIPFGSDMANRQKIYASCVDPRGIDLMAVIDAEKHVIMRYIQIGADNTRIENAHCVRISNDGSNAYVCFYSGEVVQKINVPTDQVIGSTNLNVGGAISNWSILWLNDDNTKLLVSNWFKDGPVATISTNGMSIDPYHTYTGMQYPHGITSNKSFDTFFVAASEGNCVYKLTDPSIPGYNSKISLDGDSAIDNSPTDKYGPTQYPHDLIMAPDYSKYFVTCQQTNEVRLMDAHTDKLLKVIPVGAYPQEFAMSLSPATPYLFVTCMQDSTGANPPGSKGSVYVIDYNDYHVVKAIYGDFFQPHAIAVDDRNKTFYVFSRNADGKPTHHSTNSNQPDGWYTIYNLNTLTPLLNRRYELKANPYSAAVRFKN